MQQGSCTDILRLHNSSCVCVTRGCSCNCLTTMLQRLAAATLVSCPCLCMLTSVLDNLHDNTPHQNRQNSTLRCPEGETLIGCVAHQSRPSYSPSPRMATAPCTCHRLPFIWLKPSASHTSAVDRAPFCKCTPGSPQNGPTTMCIDIPRASSRAVLKGFALEHLA